MALGRQLHAPAGLSPGNKTSTHSIGGSVGPRIRLDDFRKINISCRILLKIVLPITDGIRNTRVSVPFATSHVRFFILRPCFRVENFTLQSKLTYNLLFLFHLSILITMQRHQSHRTICYV
jgi:hypothetical protein